MPWFPITDPSRADDIRMRRRRAAMLLAGVVFVPWMLANHGDHSARRAAMPSSPVVRAPDDAAQGVRTGDASESRSFAASALSIDLPCAGTVSVLSDPALDGRVILSVGSGDGAALAAISISGGALSESRRCPDDSPVTIRTGNLTPLTLVQSGSNELRVGRFDGPVTIENNGGGDVSIDHAGTLTVRSTHSGDVTIGSITGPLDADMAGSGDLRVTGGTIPVLQATSRGSANLLLDRVTVLGGRVTLGGSGDLHLGSVSGTFEVATDASGDVVIGNADADRLTLRATGSGDVAVRTGHIAVLDAVRHGAGDLSINATVDGGRLEQSGSGDVSIPRVGALVRSGG